MFRQHTAEAAEFYEFEHRLPIGWALAGLLAAGDLAATILMLLAQA